MGTTVVHIDLAVAFEDGADQDLLIQLREAMRNAGNEFISNNPDSFRDEVF